MAEPTPNERAAAAWIVAHAPAGGRVLDIGCGDGELLALLARERGVRGTGIELSEDCVIKAVGRGLSVHHGDVEEGLGDYADDSFDLVLLNFTIQELGDPRRALREVFRVGARVLVTFPNFGHWRARWQLAVRGRAPVTANLPHAWYEGPNRHFMTVRDWEELCRAERWLPLDRGCIARGRLVAFLSSLRAEVALYLLARADAASSFR
jgi:methionine biosynthesis protein MetW